MYLKLSFSLFFFKGHWQKCGVVETEPIKKWINIKQIKRRTTDQPNEVTEKRAVESSLLLGLLGYSSNMADAFGLALSLLAFNFKHKLLVDIGNELNCQIH